MAKRRVRSAEASFHRDLLARGCLVNHYQPIVGLCSGEVFGVEVLGRLQHGTRIIPPGEFLRSFDLAEFDSLLFQSLRLAARTWRSCRHLHPRLGLSFNVGPALMTSRDFSRRLILALAEEGMDAGQITLEILEGDQFLDPSAAFAEIGALRRAGLRIALDDVGSAYSSLLRLRQLPVDSIKLDQAFVRSLLHKPDDLQFVSSMTSLARGLRKRLVIEGVESEAIVNALRVLGVDAAQGHAIAMPMASDALAGWLAAHRPGPHARTPNCLLGVYAAHLVIAETCKVLMNQPMTPTWPASIHDPHACTIGHWLDQEGLHDTPCGRAHKRFHQVITDYERDPEAWDSSAEAFRQTIEQAIAGEQKVLGAAERASCRSPTPQCERC